MTFAGHGYFKCGSQVKRVVFIFSTVIIINDSNYHYILLLLLLFFCETYLYHLTQFSMFQNSNEKWWFLSWQIAWGAESISAAIETCDEAFLENSSNNGISIHWNLWKKHMIFLEPRKNEGSLPVFFCPPRKRCWPFVIPSLLSLLKL